MFRSIPTIALAISLGGTGTALADKLDAKWAASRQEANRLGDAAKAGDKAALEKLLKSGSNGDAAAMHNLGWLNEKGSPALSLPKNQADACGWYVKAAKRGYPPSLHETAVCFLGQSKGPGSADEYEKQAVKLMSLAARGGWTKSALRLSSHYILPRINRIRRGKAKDRRSFDADISRAYQFAQLGLRTNPDASQKAKLNYNIGMSAVYGMTVDFKIGHEALRTASGSGISQADAELERLRDQWFSALRLNILGFPASATAEREKAEKQCFKKAENRTIDMKQHITCSFMRDKEKRSLSKLNSQWEFFFKYRPAGLDKDHKKISGILKNRTSKFYRGWKQYSENISDMKARKLLR